MRKYGQVDPRAILTSALLLVILLGMVTHRHKHVAPAVIRFEPALNGAAGGGQDSAFPPRRSRAPQPVKRKIFLPPMIAALETGRLS